MADVLNKPNDSIRTRQETLVSLSISGAQLYLRINANTGLVTFGTIGQTASFYMSNTLSMAVPSAEQPIATLNQETLHLLAVLVGKAEVLLRQSLEQSDEPSDA